MGTTWVHQRSNMGSTRRQLGDDLVLTCGKPAPAYHEEDRARLPAGARDGVRQVLRAEYHRARHQLPWLQPPP